MNSALNYESRAHHHVSVIAWLGFESLPHRHLSCSLRSTDQSGIRRFHNVATPAIRKRLIE